MKRSIPVVAALACAVGGVVSVAGADPGDRGDSGRGRVAVEISFGHGRFEEARRALEHAEHRLRAAEKVHHDANRGLEAVLARRASAARDLAEIERKIAECRHPRHEHELRRLHEQLDAARRDASGAEAELARLKNRAAEARRAAEAAKAEYFRRAECSPVVVDARERIDFAGRALDDARRIAVDRLHASYEWGRAVGERDAIREQIDRALWRGTSGYEVNRLKRDLAAAEDRLAAMERDAAACDPVVRDAEARLASAKRDYDQLWASIERDVARDPGYCGALADAERFERDAAAVDRDLCAAREAIARIEHDIDRLRGETYVTDPSRLEREAIALRGALDRLHYDVRGAEDCLARAGRDLHDARCAYDAALADFNRCRDDRARYERDHDRDRGRARDEDRSRYERDSHGSYRDRGDRYSRARGRGNDDDDDDDRRRTRG